MRSINNFRSTSFALLLVASLLGADAFAYSSGGGSCEADADSSFMAWKGHHPGESGGFLIEFSAAAYQPGEALEVTISHQDIEQFIGFLLYARDAFDNRVGIFTPVFGTSLSGNLPGECANIGHTITHGTTIRRDTLTLIWTPPAVGVGELTFEALALRVDPLMDSGTDFYELRATLPQVLATAIHADGFEDPL